MRSELLNSFDALAPMADVAARLCHAIASGELSLPIEARALCARMSLPQARAAEVEGVLCTGERLGLVLRSSPLTWKASDVLLAQELKPLLQGASLYKSRVHQDANEVEVVLTKPPAPSQVAAQLSAMLSGDWGLHDTKLLLPRLAESASKSLVIMTPYLDEVGAEIVVNLFQLTKAPHKSLVIRETADGQPPPGLACIRDRLRSADVSVLNFRLERSEGLGNETFHAKVVLADGWSAYVGSSNMHKWSFEYSLELGVWVTGRAAERIGRVLDAVLKVSRPLP